ncbi:MAG: hypothetical protein HY247_00840 [archaeon]|nr:MAG: hypothetical protein HY247_00840 [archaeon]
MKLIFEGWDFGPACWAEIQAWSSRHISDKYQVLLFPLVAEPRTEKAYVKYAWVIFFIFGLLSVISSPIGLLGIPPNPPSPESATGLTSSQIAARIPGISDYIGSIARQLGNFMLAMGVLTMGIAAVPFRRGEKWAWYIFWILPILLIIQLTNSFLSTPGGGFGWQFDFAFIFIILLGLFLPYRKFFPKRRQD